MSAQASIEMSLWLLRRFFFFFLNTYLGLNWNGLMPCRYLFYLALIVSTLIDLRPILNHESIYRFLTSLKGLFVLLVIFLQFHCINQCYLASNIG